MTRRARRPFTVNQPPSVSTLGEQAAAISVSSTRRCTKRDPLRDPLVGRFFHSFHPKAKYPDAPTPIVNWQGYVRGRVDDCTDDHTYLIELFSWFDGEPNGQQLQPLAGMVDWKFYSTARDMNEWYEDEYCPQVRGYSFEPAE